MVDHTLSRAEILSLPAGRLINTLIREYVLDEYPSRWSNGQQKKLQCHWFEEHPRSCAEDDGGHCSADEGKDYSADIEAAMSLASVLGERLSTQSDGNLYWASFSGVAFGDKNYGWKKYWACAETIPLAICRAALIITGD